jgi:hypothetical protein
MTVPETLKKNWIYIAFVIIVILPLIYVAVAFVMMVNEPSYALELYELNDSDACQPTGYYTENYTIAAKKYNATLLTEEDFKEFPKLAPIIRDRNQKPSFADSKGKGVYHVSYWEEEHSAFTDHFGLFGCLEFKGKRYNFNFMHVD